MKRFAILMVALLAAAVSGADFKVSQTQPAYIFERNSTAYLNGVSYAAQATPVSYTSALSTARHTTVILPSTTDGALTTGEGVGGANVIVQCVVGNTLYGIEGNVWPGRICKSTNGTSFTRTASSQAVSQITVTPAGNLLAMNNTTKHLYRSTDGGESWTDVTPTGGNAFSATVNFNFRWNYASHGTTMILAEYGTSARLGGRYIFRSVNDGVTWVRVLDAATATAVEANQVYHFHAVAYHAATGRWVALCGDDPARRTNFYSDDDGVTWAVLNAPGSYFTQPLGGGIDYGDPYYLLFGDDGFGTIVKFDVRDGSIIPVYTNFSHATGHYYIFDIAYTGGLFYAFKATTTALVYDMSILVSPDAVNWSVYHNFAVADKISQVYYAGYFGGKLHCYAMNTVDNLYKHFSVSPAKITTQTGVMVTPAVTNTLSANFSSIETNSTSWSAYAVGWTSVARSSDYSLNGSNSVKAVLPAQAATGSIALDSILTLEVGETYIASASVRGSNTTVEFKIYDRTTPAYIASATATSFIGDNWQTIYTNPFTIEGGKNVVDLHFTLAGAATGYTASQARTIYIDCVQVSKVPVKPWQIGGTDKVQDTLTETVTVGKTWTDIFAVQTIGIEDYYAADCTIKTWQYDGNNKVVLAWDFSEKKFTLTRTVGGSAQAEVASAATYWHGNAILKFALTFSPGTCELSIQNGGPVEVLTDTSGIAALTEAEITGTFGTFPMIVLTGWNRSQLLPILATDAEIAAAFNLITPEYAKGIGCKTGTLGTRTHDTLGNPL